MSNNNEISPFTYVVVGALCVYMLVALLGLILIPLGWEHMVKTYFGPEWIPKQEKGHMAGPELFLSGVIAWCILLGSIALSFSIVSATIEMIRGNRKSWW